MVMFCVLICFRCFVLKRLLTSPLEAFMGPWGPRALRLPIMGLTWWGGSPPTPAPGIGAFGADAGALGPFPSLKVDLVLGGAL